MTVIRPNSVAGINSITVQSGNSLAVHKANGELIRTITANSGVSTFSSISVGTATTDNSAAKSINIGLGASISQHNDNTLSLGTGGDERARLDANGRVLINNTSSTSPDGFDSLIQVNAANHEGSITIGRHTANANGPALIFQKSRSGTATPGTGVVSDNDILGTIRYYGSDGTDRNSYAASMSCEIDGTPGGNDMPGRLVFLTTADGAATSTERLRITSSGQVGIASATPTSGFTLDVGGDATIGTPKGTGNTFLDQKQDGDLHIINSGRTSNGASGSPGTAGVGINRFNTRAGGTSLFRDFCVYNGKDSKVLVVDGSESKVGVATDTPATTLDVRGDVAVDYAASHALRFYTQPRNNWSSITNTATDGNANLSIKVSQGEAININYTKRIGIGTDQTTSTLQVYAANDGEGTATGQITLKDTAAYNASPTAGVVFQGHHASNNAQAIFAGIRGFKANASDGDYDGCLGFDVRKNGAVAYEAMRINEDGKVSTGGGFNASSPLHVKGNTGAQGITDYQVLTLQTASTDGAANTGAGIMFLGHDGSGGAFHGTIRCLKENSTTSNRNAYMSFGTRKNGEDIQEQLRIDSDGNLITNNYGTQFGNSGFTLYSSSLTGGPQMQISRAGNPMLLNRQTSDGTIIELRRGWGAGGSIEVGTNSATYNTSSDYRLKENIVAISDGITRLKTLKPSRFNWIGDTSSTRDGFIAHEVTAVPEAITGTKDETYTEDEPNLNVKSGDPKYQGIDQSKLVPLLTAALQEAITKIETLETKVAALEGG